MGEFVERERLQHLRARLRTLQVPFAREQLDALDRYESQLAGSATLESLKGHPGPSVPEVIEGILARHDQRRRECGPVPGYKAVALSPGVFAVVPETLTALPVVPVVDARPLADPVSDTPVMPLAPDTLVALARLEQATCRARQILAGAFQSAVQRFDTLDSPAFGEFFVGAERLGVPRSVLMDEFDVSSATISRWIDRKSSPAAYARANIIRRLGLLVEAHALETLRTVPGLPRQEAP